MTRFTENCPEGAEKYLHATRKAPSSNTMLSSVKYRFREDRKRVLKLSVRKLRDIDDPESFLCRSVLINNTMKRLQQEVREEKRSSTSYNACKSYSPSPYSYFSVEKAYREEMERVQLQQQQQQQQHRRMESIIDTSDDDMASTTSPSSSSSSSSSDEEEECSAVAARDEVDDLLSEVYMPPSITPPTMIAGIDEDDLTAYPVDICKDTSDNSAKDASASEMCWPARPSTPIPWASSTTVTSCPERSCDIWCCHPWPSTTLTPIASPTTTTATTSATTSSSYNCDSNNSFISSSWSSYSSTSNSSPATSATTTTTLTPSSYSVCGEKHYSCGQSSLFGELQSVVFNSLIASLET